MLQFRCKKCSQPIISFSVRCRKWKHGNSKPLLQQFMVNLFILHLRHIHHIQQQYSRLVRGGKLRCHIHAALQLRSIYQNADQVGLPAFYELRCDDFLIRITGKTVTAGQIRHCESCALVCIIAVNFLHSLSRPVSHMLPGTGQGIKYGRFAGVRLSQKSDPVLHCASTSILSASMRLTAISVSRRYRSTGIFLSLRTVWKAVPSVTPIAVSDS